MTHLRLEGVSARHPHGPPVLHQVSLEAPAGALTALLGPNGAGKSPLLKAVLGLVPATGRITLDGQDLAPLSRMERARRIAWVPQRSRLQARLAVREVVRLGRFPHGGGRSRADDRAVEAALERARVADLAPRPFPELSGGEQQRVLVARALATGARTLLLDEPTSAQDVRQALELHRVLAELVDDGCGLLVVLHDLAEARRHASRAVLLDAGRVHAAGPVEAVIAPDPIRQVYGVELVEGGQLAWRLPGDPP